MFKWEKRDPKAPSKRADFIVCWIKDLLDERAKQTKGRLKDQYGRCCLGVACDTAKLKWDKDPDQNHYNIRYGKNNQYIEDQTMPGPLHHFLKMETTGYFKGEIKINKDDILENPSLTDLNDEYDLTFRGIAKAIQKHCELLFDDLSKKEIKYIKGLKIPTRQEMRDKKKAA